MKFLKRVILFLLIAGAAGAGLAWYAAKTANTQEVEGEPFALKIYDNYDYAQVKTALQNSGAIKSSTTFDWVAKMLEYPDLVKPGLYKIQPDMTNLELVRKLRAGDQDETRITFIAKRTPEALAEAITEGVQVSKEEFLALMKDKAFIKELGFSEKDIISMFIPDTYNVFWTIEPKELFLRLKKAYDAFWNDERKAKAKKVGLTQKEVSVLASIVQAETHVVAERPIVAGLYLNRLKKGMPLQSDPTVIFGIGDFTIKRVLNRHLETESPYNTYMHTGLPPGPINCPEISSIEGVLNPTSHNYIFMCAKCDFSGHNFASTYSQHLKYARAYQRCLDEMNIKK